jgi:hypothetical protein
MLTSTIYYAVSNLVADGFFMHKYFSINYICKKFH